MLTSIPCMCTELRFVPSSPFASVLVPCRAAPPALRPRSSDHSHSIVIATTTIIYQHRQSWKLHTYDWADHTPAPHARDGDKQISANQGLVAYDTYFETKPRTWRIMRRKYAGKNVYLKVDKAARFRAFVAYLL